MAEADRLILEAATGARCLTPAEFQQVLDHVAQAGFDPTVREKARGDLAGIEWRGRVLRGNDRLPPAERHYLKHAVKDREWPDGTTLDQYVESLRSVILDPGSGVFTSQYQGTWQIGIIRDSRELRGLNGHEWVLVEYRLATGHWVTAYQPEQGLQDLEGPRRSDLRWLRRPHRRNW